MHDPEEGFTILEQMFNEYDSELDSYRRVFDIIKAEYERVCKDNREMRDQLRTIKRSA